MEPGRLGRDTDDDPQGEPADRDVDRRERADDADRRRVEADLFLRLTERSGFHALVWLDASTRQRHLIGVMRQVRRAQRQHDVRAIVAREHQQERGGLPTARPAREKSAVQQPRREPLLNVRPRILRRGKRGGETGGQRIERNRQLQARRRNSTKLPCAMAATSVSA
jgi:hypothetical protein